MNVLGRHFIVEYYECDKDIINDVHQVETLMLEAAKEAKATIIKSVFHPFFPHGTSGVVVISESHLTIHTWPEHGYAAVDVFTCGEEADPEKACAYLREKFHSKRHTILEIKRGQSIESLNPPTNGTYASPVHSDLSYTEESKNNEHQNT